MNELYQLLRQCYNAYTSYDCNNCKNANYCVQCNNSNDCFFCLRRIHYPQDGGHYTYNCPKMVYRYVMHYFCRFCSEIFYCVQAEIPKLNDNPINIVSFGCGPNSEIYGILETLRSQNILTPINYIGFDVNNIWNPIWTLNDNILRNSNVSQQYLSIQPDQYFAANPQYIDILVMNYLLSDVSRQDVNSKTSAINSFSNFILMNRPRYLLFNDISYFTKGAALNSGFGCLVDIIKNIRSNGVKGSIPRLGTFHAQTAYTPQAIKTFNSGALHFPLAGPITNFINNCASCSSTQVLINLTY